MKECGIGARLSPRHHYLSHAEITHLHRNIQNAACQGLGWADTGAASCLLDAGGLRVKGWAGLTWVLRLACWMQGDPALTASPELEAEAASTQGGCPGNVGSLYLAVWNFLLNKR